jgi:hypothetical protein
MFHAYLPLVPLTVAGAFAFRKRTLAYGLPVLLVLVKTLFTAPYVISLFTLASLLAAVFLARTVRAREGDSWKAILASALLGVFAYDLVVNFGVWILGGCVFSRPPMYSHTITGLAQCYVKNLPYAATHLLKEVPLAVLLAKGAHLLSRWNASHPFVSRMSPHGRAD